MSAIVRVCYLFLIAAALLGACARSETNDDSPSDARATQAQQSDVWLQYIAADTVEKPFVDFSAAGAHYSEQPIQVVVETLFHPADFGAMPDDEIDDTAAIQRTINAAEGAGGGVVLFEPGVYHLNENPSFGSIRISLSNIVLRGSDEGVTRLLMTKPMPPANPNQKWSGAAMIVFQPKGTAAPNSRIWDEDDHHMVLADAAIGARALRVSNGADFSAGEFISLELRSKAAVPNFLAGKATRPVWTRINDEGVMVREIHEIERIEGDEVILRQPLLVEIDRNFPWRVLPVPIIKNVGFENIHFEAAFDEAFEHHKNAIHDSGFHAVDLVRTAHSWVRDSRFSNVTAAVTMRGGLANTVMLNVIDGNTGHFSYRSEFSTRNLFAMNIDNTDDGQWHGPGASHMSAGTVFWRYVGPHSPGVDPHGTFPRHTLYDNLDMAGFGSWGGNVKDLPNHLKGLVFWNFTHSTDRVGEHYNGVLDFWDLPEDEAQAYGFLTAIDPVLVGYEGSIDAVNIDNVLRVESLGKHVSPNSLFEAQLERRLGFLPRWISDASDKWEALKEAEFGQQH